MEPRNEIMEMFMKKFDKFKKGNRPSGKTEARCFNCDKSGHFAANCWQAKTEQLKAAKTDAVKAIEPKKQKARSAAKSRSTWADSNSEDEEDIIECFLANNEKESFNRGSDRSSREELSAALNDMVLKFKKLSEQMVAVQTENRSLKRQAETYEAENLIVKQKAETEAETETAEAGSFVSELNRLREVNSILTKTVFEKDLLIQKLNATVSAWTSSSTSHKKIISEQRPAKCKFGLGYSGAETSKTDGVTKVGKTMQFVKSTCGDTHTEGFGLLSKTKMAFKTELKKVPFKNNKPEVNSWLKPKVRAARCSEPKKKPAAFKQKNGLKFYGKHKTILFGKTVRIIKVWIPKGIINFGPN